ncbi:hypothetical protein LguiA_005557 [Lonicera macranthoides]
MVIHLTTEHDQAIWTLSPDGTFSTKSVWLMCRNHHSTSLFDQLLWHHLVPFKWFVITWRGLRNKLPVNSCLKAKYVSLASSATVAYQIMRSLLIMFLPQVSLLIKSGGIKENMKRQALFEGPETIQYS